MKKKTAVGQMTSLKPQTSAVKKEIPFPFQEKGAIWLSNKRHALLADDLGLGKSAQVVCASEIVKAKYILIVCPASLVDNWPIEFAKFHSSPETIILQVYSYDFVAKYPDVFKLRRYDLIVLDEVHYTKSPDSKRTDAVFGIEGIIRHAHRIWCVSATPAPNHAGELWVMMYTFKLTDLTYDKFVERYCHAYMVRPGKLQISGTKTKMIGELREKISGFILRRSKAEVLPDLPPIYFNSIFIDAMKITIPEEIKEKLEYERMHLENEIDDLYLLPPESDAELMSRLEALAKSVSTLRRYSGIQKAHASAMLIDQELKDGAYEKIVIFAIHSDVIKILKDQFPGAAVITGETPSGQRQKQIEKFQNNPDCKVFIGNIIAAGVGITLTAASNVIFIEQDFVPGNNAQAAMRCHRIGQKNSVYVRTVVIKKTIDEKIARILERKTKDIAKLIDGNSN